MARKADPPQWVTEDSERIMVKCLAHQLRNRGGRSDARVTMSTYAHALDPAKAQAVKASAALFGAG